MHDSEARGVLSHHSNTLLTTEGVVTVCLALHVRVGSLCGAAGRSVGDRTTQGEDANPAQNRAEALLLKRLEALSKGQESTQSGLELVRKVCCHCTCTNRLLAWNFWFANLQTWLNFRAMPHERAFTQL